MTGYIEQMRQRTFEALAQLHVGVDRLVLTDFPDYENIGDSVIALGQAAFWRQAGIEVESTYSWMTIDDDVFSSSVPVAIQGGGNFGGLYPQHSAHRYRLAERLRPDTLLIQEPQSVYFTSDEDRAQFHDRMAARANLRLAVRDLGSLATVREHVPDAALSPDSVHMLGALQAAPPRQEVLFVLRRDDESALREAGVDDAVDWRAMTFADRVRRRLSRIVREGALTRKTNRTTAHWFADAEARLRTGTALLSIGETIITDRLHAMLLALQMGRRVIAIDNANGKLSSYVDTWLRDLDAPLLLVSDLSEAREAVH